MLKLFCLKLFCLNYYDNTCEIYIGRIMSQGEFHFSQPISLHLENNHRQERHFHKCDLV